MWRTRSPKNAAFENTGITQGGGGSGSKVGKTTEQTQLPQVDSKDRGAITSLWNRYVSNPTSVDENAAKDLAVSDDQDLSKNGASTPPYLPPRFSQLSERKPLAADPLVLSVDAEEWAEDELHEIAEGYL